MKFKQFVESIENFAPLSLQEDWDHSGIQIGDPECPVNGVVLTLDVTYDAIQYAISNNRNTILSHHPLLFEPLYAITPLDYIGRRVIASIHHHLNIYSAHTNMDIVRGGVSDLLLESIGITEFEVLEEGPIGIGRYGKQEKSDILSFIKKVKQSLAIDHVIYYGPPQKNIETVAAVGGSGGDFITDACRVGADILITGDIKHHDHERAYESGLSLLDVGHYHSEKLLLVALKNYIQTFYKGPVDIVCYESERVHFY